jgi:predicted enzyme related to lactoylglutathione lyase
MARLPAVSESFAAIIGRWTTTGHVVGEPPVTVQGSDVYELLPGGHYLLHHVDVAVGDTRVRAIEVIGERDDAEGCYLARSFDRDGGAELMRVYVDEAFVFRFVGGPDIAPAAQNGLEHAPGGVRSTLSVAPDRGSMHARWERMNADAEWQQWMEIDFSRQDSRDDVAMRLGIVELFVDDQEQAVRFYADVLGFIVNTDAVYDEGSRWVTVVPEAHAVPELLLSPATPAAKSLQADRRSRETPVVSFTTADCQRTYDALVARGVRFLGEPRRMTHGGVDAVFEDGCGNLLNLHQD